jgi:hypothetical protein
MLEVIDLVDGEAAGALVAAVAGALKPSKPASAASLPAG